jgi:hypothetical protein
MIPAEVPPAPAPAVVAVPPPPPPISIPFGSAPAPQAKGGMPGWLIAVGFAVALAALMFVLFTYVLPKKSDAAASTAASGAAVPTAAAKGAKAHPLAKFLEIAGVRWVEDAKQKSKIDFIVVNHSAADLPELKMNISVKAAGKEIFAFPFTVPSIGPYESKDLSAPVQTALKEYEQPDWQYLKADFEITSQP